MSRLGINTGNNANDGQGDTLRAAMGKINSNFLEIYTTLGDTANVISYASTAGIATLARNLANSPIIEVDGIVNSGITTTEHIEVRNITSTGIITAVQFVGDGSQLTDVIATNPGVEILDENVRRGVAREINFGANVFVTPPDVNGRVTVTVPAGTDSTNYSNFAGISSYADSAGIATHATTADSAADLSGTPDVELGNVTAGIITATEFIGDGSKITGVVGEGSGVRVEDNGVIVGVAGTINFGGDLDVGPIIGGRVTITGSGIATGIEGTPDVNLRNVTAGIITATFSGDGSQLTGIPRGYWDKSLVGLNTVDNVGIGTTAKPDYALDVSGSVSLRNDATISGSRFSTTSGGQASFTLPSSPISISGGNGQTSIESQQLNNEPFRVRYMGKFDSTLQIGTSFYTDTVSIPDFKNAIFMDGGRPCIAIGAGITMCGQSGIITASGFVGDGSGITGILTGADVEVAVNAGLVGYATEGYVTSYVDSYVVGFVTTGVLSSYATSAWVTNEISKIPTFDGDYNDLVNKPAIPAALSDLTNVNAPAPTNGQVLKWDAIQVSWVAAADQTGAGGIGIALSDLSVNQNPVGVASLSYNDVTGVFSYTPPDLSGYITSLSGYATELYVTNALVGYATEGYVNNSISISGFITSGYLTQNNYATTGVVEAYGYSTVSYVDAQIAGVSSFTGAASTITSTDIDYWTQAYNWGNHANQGYLNVYNETSTLQDVINRSGIATADVTIVGIVTATNFKTPGGTSSQFLKADGSFDSNNYVTGVTITAGTGIEVLETSEANFIITATGGGGGGSIVGIDTTATSYFTDLDVSGRIVGSATSNVIPFLYNDLTDLPSPSLYHGAFAHVHTYNKAYFAHSSAWYELVNKELDGVVGTGTETYNVGVVSATSVNVANDLTVDWDIVVAGLVTATAFYGDGSGLTGVSGDGKWATNISGIHTTDNIGIGTLISSSALTVEGDGRFSGVVTATRFESASAGTPTIDSPNNLNINAVNVAISTDLTVGGNLTVNGSMLGAASSITVSTGHNNADTTGTIVFTTGGSGSKSAYVDSVLSYNPGTNTLGSEQIVVTGVTTSKSFRTNSTVGDGTDVGFGIKYYVSANGSTSYRFAGPGLLNTTDNPTFYLQRGFTYIFENSTGSNHPFRIQFTGTTIGVGTYVSGSQTGTQVFTVPFDAPSSYEYECTIHGSMKGTFNVA